MPPLPPLPRLTSLLVALAATAATVFPALAQPVSYQGRFTDNAQTPVGDYQLRFTVYNSVSGGNAVGSALTRSVTMVASDGGIFSFQDLNFGPGVFTGPLRWLEIAVSKSGEPFTALSPRQPLNPTPQAIYAERSGTTLQDAYASGPTVVPSPSVPLRIDGTLAVGSPSTNGLLQVFQAGAAAPVVAIFNNSSQGGSIQVRDEVGTTIAHLQADATGVGGHFRVLGAGGELIFDGNQSPGANSGSLFSITGPGSSLSFNTALTGNDALVLPPNSVGPDELFAAPGIASIFRNQIVQLTSSISTVTSRSITVPGPGYVVVIATYNIGVVRTSNNDGMLFSAVSDVSNTVPFPTRVAVGMPRSGLTFGQYNFPGTSHGVFDVGAAGQFTFYLNAYATGFATPTISNANLTLFFVPTTYGDVTPNMLGQDSGYGVGGGLTAEQILAEQLYEQQRALEELRAQQARMRAEMDELRRRTQNQ